MDRTNPYSLIGSNSPFSPRSRPNISVKYGGSPGIFKKSSAFSVSGKSTQSIQVVLKSPHNLVERFGQPLPVIITEALTYAERNVIVTARISECGYAWMVCGRRLLIWQYRQQTHPGTPRKNLTSHCYELQLPQSDLAHRAELVSVFLPGGSYNPACIAVSPEGIVRYWPAVVHEGISVEQMVDLQGQECDSLTDVGSLGCILATTTCTVVLVQPQLFNGRHSLNCRALRTPTGWFGGISKRMSTLIFGPMSTEHSAETRLVRVLTVKEITNVWTVYVLAGHSLQKWRMVQDELEELVFVAELNRLVRDAFQATVWECSGGQTETDTWLLDIQGDKDGVVILAAAVNMHISPQVHYAMIAVQTNAPQSPTAIRDFVLLKISGLYRDDNPADSLNYRFLLCGTFAYLYNHRSIIVIKPQEDPDTLEFNTPQDLLLGGSVCVNTPIFFLRNHGLVAVSSNEFAGDLNASVMSQHTPHEISFNEPANETLLLPTLDPEEMYSAYKDTVGQLKAAFIFSIKRQQTECNDILKQLFFSEKIEIPGVDATLDKVAIELCTQMLNDIPGSDPRWRREAQAGLGSSYSLQILKQLEDKQKAYNLYLTFLKETELWTRLAAVSIRDTVLLTVHVLGEISEQIVAAIFLKGACGNPVLDIAIEKVILNAKVVPENGLTHYDLFFKDVTKVHRIFRELANRCEEMAHSDLNPVQVAELISDTNNLILSTLKEVIQYRQRNAETFTTSLNMNSLSAEYLPWTASGTEGGLFDSLIKQQLLTYNYGTRVTNDVNLSNILYDQLVGLLDIILDGRKCHLESIRGTDRETILLKQYETDRRKLINPLIVDKEWERATLLAEKYLDFESLVVICELTNNEQRLDEYMERFAGESFSEFVYMWYLQENKQAKLIDRCRSLANNNSTQKLMRLVYGNPSLSWMQNIFDHKYDAAADCLNRLAAQETELLARKRTMLSLAKLAKLAAPDNKDTETELENIQSQLNLIDYQEALPAYVLQHYGYDDSNVAVIGPKDLINLFICNEYKEATHVEFKKALELLQFIKEEFRDDLTLKIWRRALLRDNWNMSCLDPMDALKDTVFFKIVDIALHYYADPQTLLPPLDVLMDSDELAVLQDNKSFQFLIKTGYERVHQLATKNEVSL